MKKLTIGLAHKSATKPAVCVLAVLMCLFGTSAHAAKFGVRVVTPEGQPIAGAAVCIGTAGDYKKFAALFTSVDGDVQVDVPPVPLVVTCLLYTSPSPRDS